MISTRLETHGSCWEFWKDGVSSSLLSTWLTCREQFRLECMEGWRPKKVPISFAFGTLMHWCLEHAYAKKDPPDENQCLELVRQYDKHWRKELVMPSAEALETHEMACGLAEAVLPVYFLRWAGDFKGHKYPTPSGVSVPARWTALEKQFEVRYVFPDKKTVPVRGTRDGVFLSTKGRDIVFDTKCLSVINEDDIKDTLPHNLQQMLYLWAYTKEHGHCPSGTVMNIIRRPGHYRRKDETLKNYILRVKKELSKPSKWGHYFIRFEMEILESEVLAWRRRVLDPLLQDMRGWWEGKHSHYTNPNGLVSKYGRCAMFNKIVYGNTNGLYRRKKGSIMNYQSEVR